MRIPSRDERAPWQAAAVALSPIEASRLELGRFVCAKVASERIVAL